MVACEMGEGVFGLLNNAAYGRPEMGAVSKMLPQSC